MYSETVKIASDLSVEKKDFLARDLIGYLSASALSGLYIGLGVALIFSIGAPFVEAGSAAARLVMSSCFGIALTLVIFAGCELFTGNAMIMTFGLADKKVTILDTVKILGWSWLGGLLGSLILAYLVVVANSISHAYPLFAEISLIKMNAPALELFARAILCNILVCLAIWICLRTKSDTAKILVIFWCLFGFIGAGYEHSIANMSLLAIGILANPNIAELSWGGFSYNMFWVTFGNLVGGMVFVALPYIIATRK